MKMRFPPFQMVWLWTATTDLPLRPVDLGVDRQRARQRLIAVRAGITVDGDAGVGEHDVDQADVAAAGHVMANSTSRLSVSPSTKLYRWRCMQFDGVPR